MIATIFSRWMKKTFPKARGRATARRTMPAAKPKPGFKPGVEQFEDRVVPATLTVSVSSGTGAGSLPYELSQANSGDRIVFQEGTNDISISATLDITVSDLTIDGSAFGPVTIDGGHGSLVFSVANDVTGVTLNDLIVQNGTSADGGGLYLNPGSSVTVNTSTFSNDDGNVFGGGIVNNQGILTVTNSTFVADTGVAGGAIDNAGTAYITNSTFSGNTANSSGGGIYNAGTITITDSTFSQNVATANGTQGGAIYTGLDSTTILNGDILVGNSDGLGADDVAGQASVSGSDNLVGTISVPGLSVGNGNQLGVTVAQAGLTPLGWYGGPTETYALLPSSSAIGTGYSGSTSTDQRGLARPSPSDAGAFQLDPLVVNTDVDTYGPVAFGSLSLRNAINEVDVDTDTGVSEPITFSTLPATSTTTDFSTAQTITLTGTLTLGDGGTPIAPISITGPAAGLTISGTYYTEDAIYSVFSVESGVEASIVGAITGAITITGGGNYTGAGIYNAGDLSLDYVNFVDNLADAGAAIYNATGTATISNADINGNYSYVNGGGVYVYSGKVTINYSTLTDNTATGRDSGWGGALYDWTGTLDVNYSTVSGNTAAISGGGLFEEAGATVTITASTFASNTVTGGWGGGAIGDFTDGGSNSLFILNSTFYGNQADGGDGGAIWNSGGDITAIYDTFTQNSTTASGGGIYASGGSTEIADSILVGNTGSGGADDLSGNGVSGSSLFNMVGTDNTGSISLANNNQLNVTVAEAGLAPLGWYGGPTETVALMPGSFAIGTGTVDIFSSVDQRGVARPTCSPEPDVGAYQSQTVNGSTSVIVNVTYDSQLGYGPNDQGPAPLGDITLRDAVNIVDNDTTTTEPIAFDPTVFEFEQVITLDSTAGTLILGPGPIAPVYIQGPQNEEGGIVISGGGKVTVFHVDRGVKAEISGSSSGQFQITGGAGTNGGGLAVSSGSVSARYIGFYGNTAANGGGIYNHGGTVEIHYGEFEGNSATNDGGGIYNDAPLSTGTVVLGNSTSFYANSATNDGGAIYSQGDLTLYSNRQNPSDYEDNSAANGGAIYSNGTLTLHAYGYGDTAIDFQDNTATGAGGAIYSIGLLEIYGQGSENAVYFSGNRAGTDGGAIYNSGSTSGSITDAAFENNRAASGGGIYTGGAELNVYDAYFYENYATNGNGGGIYSDAYLYVDDVGFTTNVAVNGNGGGIYAADGSGSIGAYFGSNLAIDGGGLFIGGAGTMSVSAEFSANQASGNGGAIASEGSGMVSIEVLAVSNTADLNGGAIYNTNATNTVQVDYTLMGGNKAVGDGGGLYNSGKVAIEEAEFEGNQAANGGGAFNSGTMHVTDAGFTDNTAGGSGAGVYNSGNFSATGTGTSSFDFRGNAAKVDGGGLYTTGSGQVDVSGVVFSNNSALNNGGGIYDANTNALTLANVTFSVNEASIDGGGIYAAGGALTVDPSTFSKNSAASGGAIYVANPAQVTLASDTFTGNHVSDNGGAVFNASSVTVDDGMFTSNSAASNGGGIFNSSGASASVSASTFLKNSAKNGGGIYNGSGSVSVHGGTTFSNNVASNNGGGIYNAAGLSINSSTSFTGNTATENGGGLYDNSASVTISGIGAIDFTDNTATNGDGGGLYVVGALFGDNVFDFQGNTAGNDGGGMYIQTYISYTIANSTFTGNSAFDGGGLFNQTAGTELSLLLSQFEGNTAFAGGAVFNSAGSMAVTSCQIGGTGVGQGNTALFGGGLYTTEGTVRITATTFTDDVAKVSGTVESHFGGFGGGIDAVDGGGLFINASTFNRNTAEYGGGLVNGYFTSSSITNATFYENSAGSEGGGIYNLTSDAGLSATDDTLFKNTAGNAGGGLYTLGSTVLNGDLIVGNTANSVADDVSGNPNDINVPESNDNLVGVDNTAELKFNVNNQVGVSVAQAGVQPLAYNGFGPGTVQLETCALSVGSYALGKGLVPGQVYAVNPAPTTDARGVFRPGEGYISGLMPENGDVGAFQFSNPPQVTVQPPASTTIYLPQGIPSDTTSVSTSFYANVTDIYNDYTYPSTNDTTSVPSSVQWQISTNGGVTWTNINAGGLYGTTPTTTTLVINGSGTATQQQLDQLNGDEFRAVFTNTAGETTTTDTASLTVDFSPFVTTNPSPASVVEGDTATFTAAAIGNPAPTVQWYYEAPGGSSFTMLTDGSFMGGEATITGSATTTLSVATDPNLGYLLDGYEFEAVFTNSYNSSIFTATTNPAVLNVTYEPVGIVNPASITVDAGNSATFTTSYSSANPPATVTWFVSTDNGSTYSPVTGGDYTISTGLNSSTLTIDIAAPGMNGSMYEAQYTNSVGTVTTTAAELTVDFAPTVTTDPTDVTIVAGNTTTFTATATGNPAQSVTWEVSTDGGITFNPVNLGIGSPYSVNTPAPIGLSTTTTLTVSDASSGLNQYEYEAVFTNTLTGVSPPVDETVDSTPATLTVNYPPTITLSPPDATVNAGSANTVSFTADYAPGYNSAFSSDPTTTTTQWLVSVNGGASFSLVVGSIYTVTPGADSSTLTITGPTADMDGYEYEAVFSNGISPNATTVPAVLTVDYAPTVTTNPVSETVYVGNTATFSAAAGGNPAPTVQWEVSTDGGITYTPLTDGTSGGVTYSGSATGTLTISNTTTAISGDLFEAVFTNTLYQATSPSTATSSPAELTVDESPIITTQPISTTFDVGGSATTATFTAAATGSPALPTVQWYVSDNGGASFSMVVGSIYSVSTVNGSSTLTITSPTADMNGYEYEAIFSNGVAPDATTAVATLTVDYAPTVTTNPVSETVNVGGTATFSAAASGNPTPTIQWEVSTDGGTTYTPLTDGTSGGVTYSGSATGTLTISSVSTALNGDLYEAVFTNTLSGESSPSTATSSPASLTVDEAPVISTQPTDTTFDVGGSATTATFTAVASGSPTQPTVQWYVSINGGNSFSMVSTGGLYSVSSTGTTDTSSTLTITEPTSTMNGYEYEAVFSNGVSPPATTSAATLTVDYAPTITTQPTDQTVAVGGTATFSAAASGNPAPTVQWYSEAPGASSFTAIVGATSTTLTVPNATFAMDGTQYEAVFSNTLSGESSPSTATTNAATLTVDDAPTVTTNPADAAILAGTNTSFSAAATGNPAPSATWEVSTDGGVTFAPFATTGVYSVNTVVSGQTTTTTLSITGATVGMNGYEYEAVFSNGVTPDATTTAATLSVGSAPAITVQPTNVIQSVGSTATFTAAASGSPTPTVQWYSEAPGATSFTAINGATSTTLTVSDITAAMNGTMYEAVFTNAYGAATTNTATLNTLGLVLTAGPDVLVYSTSGALVDTLTPFGTSVSSVQAQIGNVLGDGQEDLVVAAQGKIEVFHGIIGSMAESFLPYGASYTSGLNIALGNVLSSNAASVDIVVAPQVAGQKVFIFNGAGVFQASFSPFASTYPHQKYSGGLTLATGHFFSTQFMSIAVGTNAPQGALAQVWGYYNNGMIKQTNNFSFIGKGVYLSAIPGNNGRDDLVVGTSNITGTTYSSHLSVINVKTAVTVFKNKTVFGAGNQQAVRVGELDVTGSGTPEVVVATGSGSTQEVLAYTFDSSSKTMTLAETYTATELELTAGYNGGIYVG